jgi:DhnA family fructose-bisphosphate aldolase class Ia
MRRIDEKLANITSGNYGPRDFIMTFGKDADLLRGCSATGVDAQGRPRPLAAYRADVKRVIESDQADIVLTSLSTAEILAESGAYSHTSVTPAVRLNDPTDRWRVRGGAYPAYPALPFRSSRLDAVKPVSNLGLYGLTFYNDPVQDHATLQAYSDFLDLASRVGIRHFLQLSDPSFRIDTGDVDYAAYRNDILIRSLAGIARRERPLFIEVDYHGPASMEELANWHPAKLVVGITGCAGGTTRDCLERLAQAEKHGARLASFSRESFACEDPVLMLATMRRIVREGMSSFEAVKAYHDDLRREGLTPNRALQDDAELTCPMLKAHTDRAA